jgi:hypothetical protein
MASKPKNDEPILRQVEVTMQDIWNASKPAITKNKKKYNRKTKHKSNGKNA